MVKKKISKTLSTMIVALIMTISILTEGITAFAATTTDKTYTLSGWGYDFRNSGLPDAYDPLTQSNTNNQFRYQWANEFYYFKNAEDKFCYCVQLGTVNVDGTTMDQLNLKTNAEKYYPDKVQLQNLTYSTIYAYKGTCKYGYSWQVELVASQALTWTISGKYFDSSTTAISTNENKVLNCVKAPTAAAWNDMKECYKKMKADVLSHGSYPKGTVNNRFFVGSNTTYQLKYNKSNCRWETTISMDSTLSQFKLPSVSGVTFTRSGSKLKVSATETGRKNLEGQTLALTKTKAKYANKIEECTPVFLAVKNANSSSQAKVSYTAGEDPVEAYFKLTSATGNLKINKQLLTASGQKVNGTAEQYNDILFQISHLDSDGTRHYLTSTKDSDGVYTYSGSTTDSSKGLYRVGADGTLVIKGLPSETYNLSEYQTADGFKLSGDVHVTVNADKTASVTIKNSGTGSHINVYKSANDWNGSEIEDTALLEKIYSATKFRAYVMENGVKKYITAEPDTQTGSEHDNERYFIANYTGQTTNVNNAAVLSLYSDFDGYYNTSYSFFGTARLKNVPEEIERVYFEEIQSYNDFGFSNGNIKLSNNRQDVYFSNQAYYFRAGFNKYENGTTDFLSDGVFGLYAAEDVYFNGTLIYSAGQEIERADSTGATTYFNTMLPGWGTYYIQEIEAPAGYIKDDTKYEVKANEVTQISNARLSDVVLNIENEEIRFAVSKQNVYGEEVSGAQMQLIDETGGVVEEWTSDGTDHIVSGLAAGNYTLHEYYAPDGYCIATDIAVTVNEDGSILCNDTEVTAVSNDGLPLIVMIDEATKVQISKQDITGEGELPGATLQVLDQDGNVIDEWVSTEEAHYIEGVLIAGETYTLHEEIAPDGYVVANDIEFIVDETGAVTTVTMYDDTTKVEISKKSITGEDELPGASLQIIDKDGNVVDEWVSTEEAHYIEGVLIAGETYTLHEEIAPDGYVVANDVEFTVNETGAVTTVTMYDDTTKVHITKVDITTKETLEGAVLQILDKDGTVIDEWTSSQEEHVIEGVLIAGETYILHEVKAPDGYEVADDIEFTVDETGKITTVIMEDKKEDTPGKLTGNGPDTPNDTSININRNPGDNVPNTGKAGAVASIGLLLCFAYITVKKYRE